MTMLERTPMFSLLSEKSRDRASLVKMNRSRERARRRSTIDGAINGAINDFLSASEHTKLWDLVDESSMQSHNSVATTGNRYPRRGSVTKFSLDSVLDKNTNVGSLNDNDDNNTFIGTFEPNSKLPSFKSEQSYIQAQKLNNNPKEIFTIDQLPIPMKKKKTKKKKEKKKESSKSKINVSTNDLLNGKKKKDSSKRKKRRGSMVHPIDGPFDKPNNNDDDYKPTVVEELPSIGPPSPGILGRRNAVTKTSPGVLGTRNTVTKHFDHEILLEEEIGRQPPSPGILRQQRRNSVTKYSADMIMP